MTEQDQIVRVDEKKQMGRFNRVVDGKVATTPIPLTIVETHYASGRKDCQVQVPRLTAKATKKK